MGSRLVSFVLHWQAYICYLIFPSLFSVKCYMFIRPSSQSNTTERMEKIFMSYGFRVDTIGYEEVARNLSKEPALRDYDSLIFIAEHLRFSDDQVIWLKKQ